MPESAFTAHVLRGGHWQSCTAGVPTLEEAIELVKTHFRTQPTEDPVQAGWQHQPNLEFRVYRSEGHPWNPTIIEVGPDDKRPMMALALYKIIEGQWANF